MEKKRFRPYIRIGSS